MDQLLELIMKIGNLVTFTLSSNSKSSEGDLFPLPREPLVLLLILIFLGVIATLLYFVFKIDIKTYIFISTFIVISMTFIILAIIKKIYTSIEMSKIKDQAKKIN